MGESGTGSAVRRPGRRGGLRGRVGLLRIAIGVMAAVVVVLLILIGLGTLVLPSSSNPTVTITEVRWTIEQGTDSNGHGWFGNSSINETDEDGLPAQVPSGGVFTVQVTLLATSNKTIYTATADSPFTVTNTVPQLPAKPVGVDDFVFQVVVRAPSVSSDATYVLLVTLDALNAPPP